jgi:hypothetical protein
LFFGFFVGIGWQAGLHLEPESDDDRAALGHLKDFFSRLGYLGHAVPFRESNESDDDDPVAALQVLPQAVP